MAELKCFLIVTNTIWYKSRVKGFCKAELKKLIAFQF